MRERKERERGRNGGTELRLFSAKEKKEDDRSTKLDVYTLSIYEMNCDHQPTLHSTLNRKS